MHGNRALADIDTEHASISFNFGIDPCGFFASNFTARITKYIVTTLGIFMEFEKWKKY